MAPPSAAKNSPSRLDHSPPPASPSSSPRASRESRREEYLKSLHVPSPAEFDEIAKSQERRETEVDRRYSGEASRTHGTESPAEMELSAAEEQERAQAAGKIQRVYRGHRARRAMDGLSLDPSTRWDEVGESWPP